MATPNPIPSRAAINALRGVLLTTSCSVILLAEERRRRIKVARAALDNARKLHVAQGNRGPITLSESFGSLESRLTDLGDDVLSMAAVTQPSNYRRRRRDQLITERFTPSDTEIHRHSGSKRNSGKNLTTTGVPSTEKKGLGLQSIKIIPLETTSERRAFVWMPPTKSLSSNLISVRLNDSDNAAIAPTEPALAPNDAEQALPSSDELTKIPATEPQLERNTAIRHSTDETLTILEQLLGDLESRHLDNKGAIERLELATAVLHGLASADRLLPRTAKTIRSTGVRLLKCAAEKAQTKVPSILSALMPLCSRHVLQIVCPYMAWLQNKSDVKGMEQVLEYFHDRKRSPFWMHGMLVYYVLRRQARSYDTFDKTKQLYRILLKAGMFAKISMSESCEYKIRRFMVLQSLKSNDEDFALAEQKRLYNFEPQAAKFDLMLQSKLILKDAQTGKWDSVTTGIEILKDVVNTESPEFQDMLSKIMDIYAKDRPAEELEALMLQWAKVYNLTLTYRWIHPVLDHYASQHQLGSMVSLLHFCADSQVVMDSSFIQRFYARCRKYWSFSNKSIAKLHMELRDKLPHLAEPTDNKSGFYAIDQRFEAQGPDKKGGMMRASVSKRIDKGTKEGQVFEEMNALVSSQQWERTCDLYSQKFCDMSGASGSSSRCLRLAVLSHIKKDKAGIESAAGLIREAHTQGCDVSDALPPLMLAQLKEGYEADRLIGEALSLGVRIHDSVYNKAAQVLSAKGNQTAAAEMCELAARENGNGELLYNEYNFANLVFAYTGLGRYRALGELLAKFTSSVQWWRGSKTCKESIKLAMKTAAMRSVANQDGRYHRQALEGLGEALDHVKKCRSTREDRRAVTEAFIRVVRPSTKAGMRGRSSHCEGRRVKVVIDRHKPGGGDAWPNKQSTPGFGQDAQEAKAATVSAAD